MDNHLLNSCRLIINYCNVNLQIFCNMTVLTMSVSCLLLSHYIYTLHVDPTTVSLPVSYYHFPLVIISPSLITFILGLSHSCNKFHIMSKNKLVLSKCLHVHVLHLLLFTVMIMMCMLASDSNVWLSGGKLMNLVNSFTRDQH